MHRGYEGWSVLPTFRGSAHTPMYSELDSPEVASLKSVRVLSRETRVGDSALLTTEFEEQNSINITRLLMKKFRKDWKLSGHL